MLLASMAAPGENVGDHPDSVSFASATCQLSVPRVAFERDILCATEPHVSCFPSFDGVGATAESEPATSGQFAAAIGVDDAADLADRGAPLA